MICSRAQNGIQMLLLKFRPAGFVLVDDKRTELRLLEALLKDEIGFRAGVGQESMFLEQLLDGEIHELDLSVKPQPGRVSSPYFPVVEGGCRDESGFQR